jgi:hypothetical protein
MSGSDARSQRGEGYNPRLAVKPGASIIVGLGTPLSGLRVL